MDCSLPLRSCWRTLGVGFLLAVSVYGDSFTINYNNVYTGNTPEGASPWLTAVFQSVDSDTVRLSMSTPGLVEQEWVSQWSFSFNSAKNAASLLFTLQLPNTATAPSPIVMAGNNTVNAGGFGNSRFDFGFSFPRPSGAGRFGAGESLSYLIDFAGGLTVSDFDFSTAKNTLSAISVAHIQSIDTSGNNNAGNAWIRDPGTFSTTVAAVPEPSVIVLLGALLLGTHCCLRRRATRV